MITKAYVCSRRKGANKNKRYEQPTITPHPDQTVNEYAEVKETQHLKAKPQSEGFYCVAHVSKSVIFCDGHYIPVVRKK